MSAEQRNDSKRKTVERVLKAGWKLFNRHGFEGTTMSAIAAEAGLAKGTVYSYFRSKEDLYDAVMSGMIAQKLVERRARLDAIPDPVEALRVLWRDQVRSLHESPALVSYGRRVLCAGEVPEILAGKKPVRDTVTDAQQADLALILDLFTRCREAGCIRDIEPARLMTVYLCILNGLFMDLEGRTIDPTEISEDLLDIFLNGVLDPAYDGEP
jgi:AcrR family transcriptional regulator